MAEDVLISDPGKVVVAGERLTLSDWSLMTGASALVEGSYYWLSATAGRYTVTPAVAVAARVGRAVTADTMLVETGFVVVG